MPAFKPMAISAATASQPSSPRRARRPLWLLQFAVFLSLAAYGIISFVPDFLGMESRQITIPFRALVLGASLLSIFAYRRRFHMETGVWLLIAYWVFYCTRLLADTVLGSPILWQTPQEYWIQAIGIVLIPCLAFYAPGNKLDLDMLERIVIVGFAIVVALSLRYGTVEGGRMQGNSALDSISTGHFAAALILLCLHFVLRHRKSLEMPIAAILVVLGLLGMLRAASRGPVVSVIASVVFLLIISVRKGAALIAIPLAVGLYIEVPRLLQQTVQQGSAISLRMETLDSEDSILNEVRYDKYTEAVELYLQNPLTGYAVDLPESGYVHNILLEAFYSTGTFGGIVFIMLIGYGSYASFRLVQSRQPGDWIALLFVYFLVASMFSGCAYGSSQFWCCYMAVCGLYERARRQETLCRRNSRLGSSRNHLRGAPVVLGQIAPEVS